MSAAPMKSPAKPPQIQAPELMSGPERTRDTVFTALMWGVYLYLWVPLVSFLAWLFGVEIAYDVMVRTGGANGLGRLLIGYGIAVLSIFVVITVWSQANKLRYGKLSRRRAVNDVTLAAMAEYFVADPADVARLRSTKLVEIDFDEAGRPLICDLGNRHWAGAGSANAAARASQSHA